MPEESVYIGIGSNVEPERHVPEALADLEGACGPLVVSTLYRCEPLGLEGPDFINAVVGGRSAESPGALRNHLKWMEREAGRQRGARLAARELDLDLLLYDDLVVREDRLRIPRPDVLEYAFVLRPLAEIAPRAVHPETGRDFAWHWAHFQGRPLALRPVRLEGSAMHAERPAASGRGDGI